MFARIKRSGDRAYLVVVENERVHTPASKPRGHRQRVIARLGRVDHLARDDQELVRQRVTAGLVDIRAIGAKRRPEYFFH